MLTQKMWPGVVSFTLGFGQWATGAGDVTINGNLIKRDPRWPACNANAALWVDPALNNTCVVDSVSGSVSFYDTYVELVPVS